MVVKYQRHLCMCAPRARCGPRNFQKIAIIFPQECDDKLYNKTSVLLTSADILNK